MASVGRVAAGLSFVLQMRRLPRALCSGTGFFVARSSFFIFWELTIFAIDNVFNGDFHSVSCFSDVIDCILENVLPSSGVKVILSLRGIR